MTRLLVSVRDAQEARLALEAGVDWIDVKEPRLGSLGSADGATLGEVSTLINRTVMDRAVVSDTAVNHAAISSNIAASKPPLSAALGELAELGTDRAAELTQRLSALEGYRLVKLGLAGTSQWPDWSTRLATWWSSLPPHLQFAAVTYADWQSAAAPSPQDVLACGIECGAAALLVDTYRKDGRNVLDHVSPLELASLIDTAKAAGMLVVLAGSIHEGLLPALRPLAPDYVAVRGAVCVGTRDQAMDPARLVRWINLLRSVRDSTQEGPDSKHQSMGEELSRSSSPRLASPHVALRAARSTQSV